MLFLDQLVFYFSKIFHPYLSAFRSGYGCQTALLKIIEDWKNALDQHKFEAAILMDCHVLNAVPNLTHCFLFDR
jgi:hypothetical protein